MIDWKLAGTVARGVANLQPAGDPEPYEQLAGPAEEAERLVSAYTGLDGDRAGAGGRGGRPLGLDRRQPRLAGDRARAGDHADGGRGSGRCGVVAGGVMAIEAGAVSGFLAGRVLGQYEFPVLEPDKPARLLFVAPNLAQAAASLDAPADQLLRWVALHEMTHALQFGGVPWLRPHLGEMLRELLGALELDPRSMLRLPDVTDLKKLFDRVREDGLAMVVVGAGRRETLDRVQAFMAVLEGYAEHVMDAVGADVLDDLPGAAQRAAAPPARPLRPAEAARTPDRHGAQAAPVRAGQGVLRRRRRARRHRRAQPGLGGPRVDAHCGRAGRPRGLAGPHRAAAFASAG